MPSSGFAEIKWKSKWVVLRISVKDDDIFYSSYFGGLGARREAFA